MKKNDLFIMEQISEERIFDNRELYIINNVRMFLQVTTLSDITEASGEFLCEQYDKYNKYTCSSQAYKWPNIPKPTNRMFQLWKSAIHRTFTIKGDEIKDEMVSNQWHNHSEQYITWWYNKEDNSIYFNNKNDSWKNGLL